MPSTDPINAAHAYRDALTRILRAEGPHKMRQIAEQALKLTIARPTGSVISVVGNFGANTQTPYVTISTPNVVNQVPVEQAREIAQNILDQAASAEQDGMLFTFLRDELDLDLPQIGGLVARLRDYRAQFRADLDHQPPPEEPPASAA
jgi:hypothetical protein